MYDDDHTPPGPRVSFNVTIIDRDSGSILYSQNFGDASPTTKPTIRSFSWDISSQFVNEFKHITVSISYNQISSESEMMTQWNGYGHTIAVTGLRFVDKSFVKFH